MSTHTGSWTAFILIPLLAVFIVWSGAEATASALRDSPFSRAVSPPSDPPRNSTGLTDVVQWDNYTLFVHGQRIFLQYVWFHLRSCRLLKLSLFTKLGGIPPVATSGS